MTNTRVPHPAGAVNEALETLKDIADGCLYADSMETTYRLERAIRATIKAITDVDARLTALDERLDRGDKTVDLLAKTIDRQNEQIEQLNLESCNRVSTAMAPLEMEAPLRPRMPATLLDLLADCDCGAAFEIVEIGGCNSPITRHARCSDPTCPGNSVYIPVSAETARAYNDRIAAEEQSFGVQQEEAIDG